MPTGQPDALRFLAEEAPAGLKTGFDLGEALRHLGEILAADLRRTLRHPRPTSFRVFIWGRVRHHPLVLIA